MKIARIPVPQSISEANCRKWWILTERASFAGLIISFSSRADRTAACYYRAHQEVICCQTEEGGEGLAHSRHTNGPLAPGRHAVPFVIFIGDGS